jgi:prephenate dehydratase
MTSADNVSRSIAYLGPTGTFTEQAVYTQPDLAAMEHVTIGSIVEVLRATERGDVDLGFVAIENMIEGSVNATIDTLAFDTDLLIQREVIISVNLNLLVLPGVTLDEIEHVRSYPVAYAQCRRYLADHLTDAPLEATNSTADAARELARSGDRTVAAIAPQRSAEVYGLEVLAADIEDHPENQTRFVLVGRDGVPPPSGHDKTSILVYQSADAPGSLVGILQEFAARSINLTNLQSRPTRAGLGDYCFLMDCEGHITDEVVADALRNLHMKTANVKFLGSYPSAYGSDDEQEVNRAGVAEAAAWVDDLRGRITG